MSPFAFYFLLKLKQIYFKKNYLHRDVRYEYGTVPTTGQYRKLCKIELVFQPVPYISYQLRFAYKYFLQFFLTFSDLIQLLGSRSDLDHLRALQVHLCEYS